MELIAWYEEDIPQEATFFAVNDICPRGCAQPGLGQTLCLGIGSWNAGEQRRRFGMAVNATRWLGAQPAGFDIGQMWKAPLHLRVSRIPDVDVFGFAVGRAGCTGILLQRCVARSLCALPAAWSAAIARRSSSTTTAGFRHRQLDAVSWL